MTQRKLILYIAASLDGYIAKPDGDIEWLSMVEAPQQDYGYKEFVKTVDTIIMGRKTYEKVLSFGIPWPHAERRSFILSRTRSGGDENVTFFNGDVGALVAQIRQTPGLNIYCDGGAEVVYELMRRDLIDQYVISVIPILLGEGIPLFKPGRPRHNLTLLKSTAFPSGLVQMHFERKRDAGAV
ncbi:MAG: dihydrofolate reductase [Saprospiraceae bacterium]|nr:dihydrofolate reductase [Saprospiraceae bacterium]